MPCCTGVGNESQRGSGSMEAQVAGPAEAVNYFQGNQSASVAAGIRRRGLPAGCPGESEQEHNEDQFEHLPLTRKVWSGMKVKKPMHIDELGGGTSPCPSR